MRKFLLATTAILGAATAPALALAETAPAPAAVQPQVSETGVLTFTPDFFASYNPSTAADMVDRVPGFSVNDGDGARGFEGAVGNVLINGARPASKNDTGSSLLARTPAHRVERIELIRGGAPGIEMQGYGVVVNVILKAGASTEQVISHNSLIWDGGRSLFGGNYQLTHRKGEYTYGLFLSDSIASSDSVGEGPYIRRDANGVVTRNEYYDSDAYGGGNGIRGSFSGPLLGGNINLTARYGISDWHNLDVQNGDGILSETFYDSKSKTGEFGATYTRAITPRLKSETRLIHEWDDTDGVARALETINDVAGDEQLFTTEDSSSETILRSLVRFQKSETLEYEVGGEVAFNRLETQQAYSIGNVPVALPSASVTVEELRGELFGKGTWRINPKWTMEAGLRLEHSTISQSGDVDSEESFFFAKPRVQLTWNPRENTQIRVRVERSVGQLNFGDFAASAELASDGVMGGNVNLTPEQRWIGEIAFEQRFMKEGIFSVTYSRHHITDVIDVIPLDGGLSAVGNIGDGTLDQLDATLTVPTDRLFIPRGKLTFTNTWNSSEVTDPTTGRSRPISGLRPTDGRISFEQNVPSWKLSWGANWIPLMKQYSYRPDQMSGWTGRDYYELWVDYKPMPTLSIRAQMTVWDSFYWQREVYADRDTRPISFSEVRDIAPRPIYQLRMRKTF